MSDGGWTTIESEPGVFHQLIREFGVKGLQVEELWSLDKESVDALKPVHGLIFLFKYISEKDSRTVDPDAPQVFFAKQVIQNACATQAILAILLNAKGVDLGTQLKDFKEFTADFPADMKGLAIGNSDSIRIAHNGFARPEPMVPDEREASASEDAFHFISYVPVAGTLYELDGLKEGPIPLCPCSEEDWLDKVIPQIQERMARYAEKEVRFNVMAIVADRLEKAQAKARKVEALRRVVQSRLGAPEAMDTSEPTAAAATAAASGAQGQEGEGGFDAELREVEAQLPASQEGLQSRLMDLDAELAVLHAEMQEEQEKRHTWHEENIRRRHNYIPLVFNLLQLLGEHGKLQPLIERAKTLKK